MKTASRTPLATLHAPAPEPRERAGPPPSRGSGRTPSAGSGQALGQSRQAGARARLGSSKSGATPERHLDLPAPLVTAVQQAVTATFDTICGTVPTSTGRTSTARRRAAVIGVISFVGDHLWSIMLGVPRDTAAPLALAFAGLEADFDSAEMGDIVGELANVLAGQVIALLDEQGIRAEMSLPTVVRGSDIDVLLPGEVPSVDLAFRSTDGPFWVGLALANPGWSIGRRPGH